MSPYRLLRISLVCSSRGVTPILVGREDQVSADYFGEFARLMPSRFRASDDFVAMMSNGASGDINNIPFLLDRPPREPGEQVRIVGSNTADAGWHAWNKIEADQYAAAAPLGMIERDLALKLREPTEHQVQRARTTLDLAAKGETEGIPQGLPKKAESYARKTLDRRTGGRSNLEGPRDWR